MYGSIRAVDPASRLSYRSCCSDVRDAHREQESHKAESEQIRNAITDLKIEFTEAIHTMESKYTEAINNNTLVMQKLLDKLEEK